MERQLQGAISLQKQYQNMYETACAEYQRLWLEFTSSEPSTPLISPGTAVDGFDYGLGQQPMPGLSQTAQENTIVPRDASRTERPFKTTTTP
jgi:hypothetical protein